MLGDPDAPATRCRSPRFGPAYIQISRQCCPRAPMSWGDELAVAARDARQAARVFDRTAKPRVEGKEWACGPVRCFSEFSATLSPAASIAQVSDPALSRDQEDVAVKVAPPP